MSEHEILYIAGEGRSGTTLLDIILGNQESAFSTGELVFFGEKGILNREYCSCGETVPDCAFWEKVITKWDYARTLSLKEYIQIRKQLVSKKKVFQIKKQLENPERRVRAFLDDTDKLYSIIFEITGSKTIIDSSKSPGIIPILEKLSYTVTVIHITRRFGDVLNSYKDSRKKDLKAGIEHDIKPSKTAYILYSWVTKNFMTAMHSRGMRYKKIRYENLIDDLEACIAELVDCNPEYLNILENRGPLYPAHLVAGSRIRMKKEITVAHKPMGSSYHRLRPLDKILARTIDAFY